MGSVLNVCSQHWPQQKDTDFSVMTQIITLKMNRWVEQETLMTLLFLMVMHSAQSSFHLIRDLFQQQELFKQGVRLPVTLLTTISEA